MRKIMIALAIVGFTFASVPASRAQATVDAVTTTKAPSAKQARLAECRVTWKAHKEANGKPEKGKGREAYTSHIRTCIASKPL